VTEQTNDTRGAGFVDELGPLFNMWGDAEGRECLRADLANAGAGERLRLAAAFAVPRPDTLTPLPYRPYAMPCGLWCKRTQVPDVRYLVLSGVGLCGP